MLSVQVAIVHDWLTGMRGGEKVLSSIIALFPEADLYTLFHFPGTVSPDIEGLSIRTSFLQRLPFSVRAYRFYLPLYPSAIETFDLSGYDLVVSTSHCVAKGAIPSPHGRHIAYLHTPMRYIWDQYRAYVDPSRSSLPARVGMRLFRKYLRRWDVSSSARVSHFLANSNHVASRIKRYYGRDAEVIYPPVDTDFFTPHSHPEQSEGYLVVSALVPYKNIEIAILAFNRLGLPLTIVGKGPSAPRLQALAGPTVRFIGWLGNDRLREEYRKCRALIFPGEEDFGITAVEAQACGRPVIAYRKGGVCESVIEGVTGVFFDEAAPEPLARTIDKFDKTDFNYRDMRANACRFSEKRFREEFSNFVRKKLDDKTF
ncbi:glycosyltransferase [Acidobacteriota bacterium]